MGSEFHEFQRSGFAEAAREVSPTDAPLRMFFGGRFADVYSGAVAEAQEMRNAGVDPVFDESCAMLSDDFELLGARFEDVVEVGKRRLRIKSIQHAGALVVVGLKAVR